MQGAIYSGLLWNTNMPKRQLMRSASRPMLRAPGAVVKVIVFDIVLRSNLRITKNTIRPAARPCPNEAFGR